MYVFNENGFFLFESDEDMYQYKTNIAPPFDEYDADEYDFKFNVRSEKWSAIPKERISIIDEARRKRDKKILKKSGYNNQGGIKVLKTETDTQVEAETQDQN